MALSVNEDGPGGVIHSGSIDLTYAQHIGLAHDKVKIIPSLQFGVGGAKYSSGYFLYNNALENITYKNNFVRLNAGLLVNFKNLYVGASAFDLNTPSISKPVYQKIGRIYSFNASYPFLFSDRHLLSVYARDLYYPYGNFLSLGLNAVLFRHLQYKAVVTFCCLVQSELYNFKKIPHN